MISVDQEHLTTDIAHAFIAQVAPQELVVFEGISEAYLRDPERFVEKRTGKEDLLGLGGAEVVAVITPVVLTILTNVLSSIIHEAMKVHTSKGWSALKNKFNRRGKRQKEASTILLPLTPEQLARVHRLTLEEARKLNLSEPYAALLADTVVKKLSTTQPKHNP